MSQRTFLIADLHLGHKKIIHFEPKHRPFKDIEEHDAAIRSRWNSVVRDNDLVYVLGDVAFNKIALNSLGTFHGKKVLVAGNHDKFSTHDYLYVFDGGVYGACKLEDIILTHIPIHPQEMRWRANIHGHTHSNEVPDPRYFCVSAEQIGLTPIDFEEVKHRLGGLQ